ncbi:MAG: hypothetical protein ACLFU9_07225 [Candidatus Bathyarchaeia archaeon]
MNPIKDFAEKFNTNINLDPNLTIKKQNRYYLLLNQKQKQQITQHFYYAGTYLGKHKNQTFFPSFNLLQIIAKKKKANKTTVDQKTEWLFTCKRDIFKQGILKTTGSKRKGNYTLVLNQYGECLGFGKITHDLDKQTKRDQVVVKNILDIGDFLRREQKQHHL